MTVRFVTKDGRQFEYSGVTRLWSDGPAQFGLMLDDRKGRTTIVFQDGFCEELVVEDEKRGK